MAGAGYKLFNTGDVLTAQQVNEYLQQQTVMVFANSTARTTALSGVLAEGMMSYLQDTDSVQVYNGSSWVAVGGSGDKTLATIASGSVTSGTTLTVSSLTQDYLVLYIAGFDFGTAGQITLRLNGSTSSIYNYNGLQIRTGGNTTRASTQTGTGFSLSSNGNNADYGNSANNGTIVFSNAKAAGFTSVEWIFSYRDASGNDNFNFGSGWFESAAQMTSFTITFPGTLSAGTYELIGG